MQSRQSVCLIVPPSPFLLDERVFISLGVLKVAASLELSGHTVDILDLSGEANYLDRTRDYVSDHSIDSWGITATTPQMPSTMKILGELPKDGWTILGGPHATLVHAAYRNGSTRAQKALDELLCKFSVVAAGDGERSIHLAIDHDSSPALIDADDPKSDLFLNHQGFTNGPWPARHLVDMDSYHYEIDGHKATSIVAQLGCPFGCNFCGGRLSPMLRRVRLRDTNSILSEITHLYCKYGYTGFMFYDDELNVNPKLKELLAGIITLQDTLKVGLTFRGFVKAELFQEWQAELMYQAGFRWLLCGFESGSPRILRNINKRATTADNSVMLKIAHDYGIKVKALMSLGHPGESEDTIQDTEEWLLENHPDDFDMTVITVYPGTPYYDSATHVKDDVWKFVVNGDALYHQDIDFTKEQAFYKGIPGTYKSYVWTDHLPSISLVMERDRVERKIRGLLDIPYPQSSAQINYEKSMGQ